MWHCYEDTNWTDKLTSYNGQSITYDEIGNPLSYRGMTMDWTGRRLDSIVSNGTTSSYLYDANGIRTRKTVGSTMTDYFTNGSTILAEKTGSNVIWYIYDSEGDILGLVYNGTPYYYLKNAQGDVVSIVDASMNVVGSYTYDAWGKVTSASGSMAQINPIRYRGYYYDTETGFYSLQSRYYDPEIGRFINADNQLSTGSDMTGMNLFAYCGNNPVMRVDPTGHAWWHWAIGAAIVAACAVATVVTAGGFAAGMAAVAAVGSGMAAATTASTVAAAAFIGSATYLGVSAMNAAASSSSVSDFCDQGNWGTVAGTAISGVAAGVSAYASTRGSSSTSSGRGTQNPKVKAAVQKGQAMHKQMDYGPGTLKEVTIAPKCRVDGIDFNNNIIYELKPNNPQAISRGLAQLDRYTAAASQQYGGEWTGVLKLYD